MGRMCLCICLHAPIQTQNERGLTDREGRRQTESQRAREGAREACMYIEEEKTFSPVRQKHYPTALLLWRCCPGCRVRSPLLEEIMSVRGERGKPLLTQYTNNLLNVYILGFNPRKQDSQQYTFKTFPVSREK